MGALCGLGYYSEKMEKESKPFLILTLLTTSEWSRKQGLVSAEAPEGQTSGDKAKVPSFPLL